MTARLRAYGILAALLCVCMPLVAQAPAQSGSLAGNWHFILIAGDGNHELDATFKVDGAAVTGIWAAAEVKGTFREGQFDLEFPFSYTEGNLNGSMHLKGKLADEKLTGTWEFAGYNGDFSAARPK